MRSSFGVGTGGPLQEKSSNCRSAQTWTNSPAGLRIRHASNVLARVEPFPGHGYPTLMQIWMRGSPLFQFPHVTVGELRSYRLVAQRGLICIIKKYILYMFNVRLIWIQGSPDRRFGRHASLADLSRCGSWSAPLAGAKNLGRGHRPRKNCGIGPCDRLKVGCAPGTVPNRQ